MSSKPTLFLKFLVLTDRIGVAYSSSGFDPKKIVSKEIEEIFMNHILNKWGDKFAFSYEHQIKSRPDFVAESINKPESIKKFNKQFNGIIDLYGIYESDFVDNTFEFHKELIGNVSKYNLPYINICISDSPTQKYDSIFHVWAKNLIINTLDKSQNNTEKEYIEEKIEEEFSNDYLTEEEFTELLDLVPKASEIKERSYHNYKKALIHEMTQILTQINIDSGKGLFHITYGVRIEFADNLVELFTNKFKQFDVKISNAWNTNFNTKTLVISWNNTN